MAANNIGLDISKNKFDAACLSAEGKYKHKKFDNTSVGFAAFVAWLLSLGVDKPLIGMEATSTSTMTLTLGGGGSCWNP